jgi:YidB-like protein
LDKLQKGGLGGVANSWVGSGQNQPVLPKQLGPAIGPDVIKTLAAIRPLIHEPFQSAQIGPFTVLAPSPQRYGQLILDSEKTPQRSIRSRNLLSELAKAAKPLVNLIRVGWGAEKFSIEETSVENEMSVVQYANLCDHKILLTGDAGRDAMNEAEGYAPSDPKLQVLANSLGHFLGSSNFGSHLVRRLAPCQQRVDMFHRHVHCDGAHHHLSNGRFMEIENGCSGLRRVGD